jgi:hypothetical protein
MGYRVRVLSTSDQHIPLIKLEDALKRDNLEAKFEVDPGQEASWEQITLCHIDGTAISSIERNPVIPGSLGEAEIEEFGEEIEGERPENAVAWLKDYFERVRTIYALQVLNGTYVGNGWDILGCAKGAIWNFAPSILQADAEGFSNEDGYHILWQFSDQVKGGWAMGVLSDAKWLHFQMDLGNRKHRDAFCKGQVPSGCKIITK